MKFSEDLVESPYQIRAYGTDFIQINTEILQQPFIISPHTLITDWVTRPFAELQAEQLTPLLQQNAKILLIGTGRQYTPPSPDIQRFLVESHVGFEVMNTAAACRTFTILLAESRSVAAAFFL